MFLLKSWCAVKDSETKLPMNRPKSTPNILEIDEKLQRRYNSDDHFKSVHNFAHARHRQLKNSKQAPTRDNCVSSYRLRDESALEKLPIHLRAFLHIQSQMSTKSTGSCNFLLLLNNCRWMNRARKRQ